MVVGLGKTDPNGVVFAVGVPDANPLKARVPAELGFAGDRVLRIGVVRRVCIKCVVVFVHGRPIQPQFRLVFGRGASIPMKGDRVAVVIRVDFLIVVAVFVFVDHGPHDFDVRRHAVSGLIPHAAFGIASFADAVVA